jgi:sugar/nucleoside kinase (ribokinase family)
MVNPVVFCYGEIGVDCIIQVDEYPRPHNAVFPLQESCHPGGSALTTALWLAHLGIETGLGGNAIGGDFFGELLTNRFNQFPHLHHAGIEKVESASTPYTRVLVTPDAERVFLIFGYQGAKKGSLTREMVSGASFLALDLYGGRERLEAARLAHSLGLKTVISDIIDLDHPALPFTSIAVISAAYLREKMPGVDCRTHARVLQEINHGIIILTDGLKPVFCLDSEGRNFTAAPAKVNPVDSTGCGDAFRAGLIYGLLQGLALKEAVCWGVAAGTIKVQHLGGSTTLPDPDEIALLAGALRIDDLGS